MNYEINKQNLIFFGLLGTLCSFLFNMGYYIIYNKYPNFIIQLISGIICLIIIFIIINLINYNKKVNK